MAGIGTPWDERERAWILGAPTAGEAVQRAASCAGFHIPYEYAADAIARAAQSWADSSATVREAAGRLQWESGPFRDYLRQDMRWKLLDLITREGRVPVSLPAERIAYLADPFAPVPGIGEDFGGREIPRAGSALEA